MKHDLRFNLIRWLTDTGIPLLIFLRDSTKTTTAAAAAAARLPLGRTSSTAATASGRLAIVITRGFAQAEGPQEGRQPSARPAMQLERMRRGNDERTRRCCLQHERRKRRWQRPCQPGIPQNDRR